jgi:hypothetical protein
MALLFVILQDCGLAILGQIKCTMQRKSRTNKHAEAMISCANSRHTAPTAVQ